MTGEWREPGDIAADLVSGDPARIRAGLAYLREFSKAGDELEMPAIDISVLAPFGDAPPPDAVENLAHLLSCYHSFVPMPSRDDVIIQLVELDLRYAESLVIYKTSLEIQSAADPVAAAHLAIGYLGTRGLATPSEIEVAGKLIFYQLEAKLPVRRAVGEALAMWPAGNARKKVVTYVRPMIEPDQRALVTPDGPPLASQYRESLK